MQRLLGVIGAKFGAKEQSVCRAPRPAPGRHSPAAACGRTRNTCVHMN